MESKPMMLVIIFLLLTVLSTHAFLNIYLRKFNEDVESKDSNLLPLLRKVKFNLTLILSKHRDQALLHNKKCSKT
jgi:hypothetical protein